MMNTQERIRFKLSYFDTLSEHDTDRIFQGFEYYNELVTNSIYLGDKQCKNNTRFRKE